MDVYEYQKLALRTESIVDEVNVDVELLRTLLQSFITVGEMLDCVKKDVYYRNPKKMDASFDQLASKLMELSYDIVTRRLVDKYMADAIASMDADSADFAADMGKTALNVNPRVFHGIIGIATEAAELVEALDKGIETGRIDPVNIQEEMGDGAGGSNSWYAAILHDALDLDPIETQEKNINKLAARYSDKYTDYEADQRNIAAERAVLEGKNGGI